MSLLNKSKLLSLWEQSYALSYKIEELLNKSYSIENINIILNEIKRINDKFMKEILTENFFDQLSPNAIGQYNHLFKYFYNCVGAISNCNTSVSPYEVMIPVKEIFRKLNSKEFVLTEPTWEVNYAIGMLFSEDFKVYSNEYDFNISNDFPLIRIQFPAIHQDNVLLGAIMGHEVGHYLDLHQKLNISDKILGSIINKFDFPQFYKFLKFEDENISDNIKDDILKGILPKIVLKNWVHELTADIIGIILYSLASHFACEQIFLYYGLSWEKSELLDKYSLTHPRHFLRSLTRIEAMKNLKYDDYISKEVYDYILAFHGGWEKAKIDNFENRNYVTKYSSLKVSFEISNDSLKEVESNIINHYEYIVNSVIEQIRNFNNNLFYDPARLKNIVEPLAVKIENLIPPNEIDREPVDSISIINSGWIAYLIKKDSIRSTTNIRKSNNNDKENRDLINNLIKKALSSSDLHRRWKIAVDNKKSN